MEGKKTQGAPIIYWAPRVLSILFIVFLAIFSLDVFDGSLGFLATLFALFMHNIPSLVLLAVLLVAWKYEIVGAVAYFLAGLLYVFLVFHNGIAGYEFFWTLLISGPAFLIGALFLVGWIRKRKSQK